MVSTELISRPNGAPRAGLLRPDLVRQDATAAVEAAAAFLTALGVSLDAAHLAETPRRMAAAFAELLVPPQLVPTAFDSGGYDGLVVLQGIAFHSLCAHHGLPFVGHADVG
jgi:GTP cyclohydrolase IA